MLLQADKKAVKEKKRYVLITQCLASQTFYMVQVVGHDETNKYSSLDKFCLVLFLPAQFYLANVSIRFHQLPL